MLRVMVASGLLSVSAPSTAATVQQDFDAAQVLLDAGKFGEARSAFIALRDRLAARPANRSAFIVRARLGTALIGAGDFDAAQTELVAAIGGLSTQMPQDREEHFFARFELGRAQELGHAPDTAAVTYRSIYSAKAFATDGPADLALQAALARTLIWSEPAEARRLLDALLAVPPAKFGSGDSFALVHTLRGRVELNNGQPAEARRWFSIAARLAGGSQTRKVSIADVRIRGDLALANQQLSDFSETQRYVALSGAGALAGEGLTSATAMPLPSCAPASGLAADAVAVVEFAIGDDGRVVAAVPVFASRGTGPATARDDGPEAAFPRAVRGWFWAAQSVQKLNPFWRQAVRVELRCFTARPDFDPLENAFRSEEDAWSKAMGLRGLPKLPDNDAAALPLIRAELVRREREDGTQSLQLIPVLDSLADNLAASGTENRAAAARRKALVRGLQLPFVVRTKFRLDEILWEGHPLPTRAATLRFLRTQREALLAEVEVAGEGGSRIAMLVRLRLGEVLEESRDISAARVLFQAVAAAPETIVAGADPIRTTALLRLSNIAAAARDTAAAASAFAATGLTAEQCSLIDIKPQSAINNGIHESTFPSEAARWGTGGFARVGYDITVDGRPINVRTIVASPPFVFGQPTERAISQFRFRPVYRPGNVLGCTGSDLTVRFRVAG